MIINHSDLSAKQLQKRAHHLAIEEVYTENEVNRNFDYDKNVGYNFNYPPRWLNAFSERKMIGIRRLDLKPTCHIFDLQLREVIYTEIAFTTNNWIPHKTYKYNCKPFVWSEGSYTIGPIFTDENFYPEGSAVPSPPEKFNWRIIDDLEICTPNDFGYMLKYDCYKNKDEYFIKISYLKSDEKVDINLYKQKKKNISILDENDTTEIMYSITELLSLSNKRTLYDFEYNPNKGNLKLSIHDAKEDDESGTHFAFNVASYLDHKKLFNKNIIEFLKFLNQKLTIENYLKLLSPVMEWNFENVWNRKKAVFHSTFSNCKRNYIGLRNDFWPSPTKTFIYSNAGQEFYVRFTTNGIDPFLPEHSELIIELVFIVDYKNINITK